LSLMVAAKTAFAAGVCPDSEIAGSAVDSPLYRLLVSRYGKPADCKASQDGGTQTLSIRFPAGAALAWSVQSAIEFSRQEATLPAGVKPLSAADAVKVLRATETSATGGDGCHIAWSRLSAGHLPADGRAEAQGSVCNCKAELTREKGAVVKLGFSSAC
jgi:hypothetical protein